MNEWAGPKKKHNVPFSHISQVLMLEVDVANVVTLEDVVDIPPARKKGHNPKSPEDDAKGGDLYIKLPNQHRLRKVRNTIYGDPGNPFDLDFDDTNAPLLPSNSYEPAQGSHVSSRQSWESWHAERAEDKPSPRLDEQVIPSMLSDPFDLVTVRDDRYGAQESQNFLDIFANASANAHPPNEGSRAFTTSHRRSLSIDIALLPSYEEERDKEITETQGAEVEAIPTLHAHHPSGDLFAADTKRHTEFYDFYDDLLAEYGIGNYEDATTTEQKLVPMAYR